MFLGRREPYHSSRQSPCTGGRPSISVWCSHMSAAPAERNQVRTRCQRMTTPGATRRKKSKNPLSGDVCLLTTGVLIRVRHAPEQGQSVDPCAPACAAGGPAHPRRCPCPFAGRPGPAARRLGSRCDHRRHTAGGRARARLPPFAHDGTERRIVRPQDAAEQKASYSGKKRDHTVKNVLLVNALLTILFLSETYGGRTHDLRIAEATP
jgi:DDE superfamily endonuclease